MATVIDTLFLELGIDSSKFSSEADKAEKQYGKLEQAVVKTEKADKGATKAANENAAALKKNAEQGKKSEEQIRKLGKGVAVAARNFMAFAGLLLGASGLAKLATDAAKANVSLDNTAKNLNMSRKELSAWKGAAEMAGSSADGMAGYMQTLSGDIMNLVMMGDTSVLPYFNALGVSLLDSSGKARALDDVMLDLADRMGSMNRQQAYNLARQMGMDEGTANTMMRGRSEMERMLAVQRDMYKSSEADIENARKLTEARAVLNAKWESLQLMIGNALIPVVTYLTEKVSDFVGFLTENEHLVKGFFIGIAAVLGVMLLPLLAKAALGVIAFLLPFAPLILAVTALGAAFAFLYDDYKTWAEGGKSLFDWSKFDSYIKNADFSVDNLGKAFTYLLTGYTDWSEAANSLLDWLKLKGFIDENGVSVDSLLTGFKNLASEIADKIIPLFKAVSQWVGKIADGDFKGAFQDLKDGAFAAFDSFNKARLDFAQGIVDRVAGTIDTASGRKIGTLKNSMPTQTGGNVAPKGWKLGQTSSKFETGGKGAGTISTGKGDYGGVSYGSYQMSSKLGVVQKFIKESAYKDEFSGLAVNSEAFKNKWRSLAKSDPKFAEAQHEYIKKTHYDVLMRNLKKRGVDLSQKGAAVQDAIWSTAVQYGGGSKIIDSALKGKNVANMSDSDIVIAIQNYKHNAVQSLFKSSPTLWGGLKARAKQEKAALLKLAGSSSVSQPIGGAAAANIAANKPKIEAQKQAAQSAGKTVNKKTEVSVNNVTIQTSSSTMSGAGKDFGNALAQQIDQYSYGMS